MFQLDIHRSSEPGLQHPWHEKICSSELSSKQHLDCSNTLYSHIASAKSLSNSYVSQNLNSSALIVQPQIQNIGHPMSQFRDNGHEKSRRISRILNQVNFHQLILRRLVSMTRSNIPNSVDNVLYQLYFYAQSRREVSNCLRT